MSQFRMILLAGIASLATLTVAHAQSPQAQSTQGQNTAGQDIGPPAVKAMAMMASAVPSSDLDRSIAFYTKGLGLTLGGRVEMAQVTEAPLIFPGGGSYLMLIKTKTAEAPLPARSMSNRVVLAVPDVKAVEARLTAAGYHLDRPIVEETQYHVAVGMVQDPDGNHVELVQRTQ
jgi:predicted enzyme related to lactoylglutathione lyase